MGLTDDEVMARLMAHHLVHSAAAVTHQTGVDPLVVLGGYVGARVLERRSFRMAWLIRLAVQNVLADAKAEANKRGALIPDG